MPEITDAEWEAILPEAEAFARARILHDEPHMARDRDTFTKTLGKIRIEHNLRMAQVDFERKRREQLIAAGKDADYAIHGGVKF